MNPVETYLEELRDIYRTGGGTSERSYYGPLERLFNEVGKSLKPSVRSVANIADTGAGLPDFGFYTNDQFAHARDENPIKGQMPSRGVVECKPWDDGSVTHTKSAQVSGYWSKYGLVLVTNYRDFVLVGRDQQGKATRLGFYSLADSKDDFIHQLAHPREAAAARGEGLIEFLMRTMRHAAPIDTPKDLAWFLASYAKEARARVEKVLNLDALLSLKRALEDAIGMRFEGEKGEHFFRSTLVQTLFYGVFSGWVLWARDHNGDPAAKFNWHEAGWTLHVPMIATLFAQIAAPQKLKPLGVDEVLDWTGAALNRVDRPAFFSKFEEEHAVQYFYEPFLEAYDHDLRKSLGVWYTPPEIVRYQVERVDRVLREELKIVDGLAAPQVVVLDPCCGTGAYLVETLKRIHKTLDQKGADALTAQKLKTAAMDRIFGFEILPAPFVVSHLQIGLMLRVLGAPIEPDSEERAGVYLTNALTGWEPPLKPKDDLPLFPEMVEEREAANKVKCDAPILVIMGNPPYNAFAGTSPDEEGGIVDRYKENLAKPLQAGGWGIKKFNLDDLYVRFFRIAERRIAKSGRGVISYISNFSYLGDPSYVVMRQVLLSEFSRIWVDCMNGDSRETGKLTPDGKPDPSVFSTGSNRAGIRVGTAICVMVKKTEKEEPVLRFRHFWGVNKRKDVLASLDDNTERFPYTISSPSKANRFSFRPVDVQNQYLEWPLVSDLGEKNYNGPVERRNFALISINKNELIHRLRAYFEKDIADGEVARIYPALLMTGNRIEGPKARQKIIRSFTFDELRIVRYPFKPFDVRWCYLDNIRPLFSEPSPDLLDQRLEGNGFLITRDTADKAIEGTPFYFSRCVSDYDCISGHARHFPVFLSTRPNQTKPAPDFMFGKHEQMRGIRPNLSSKAVAYLSDLLGSQNQDQELPWVLWMHVLAIGYSRAYLKENGPAIRTNWPRIPMPRSKEILLQSADLGRHVGDLLDTEKPITGVTTGQIDPLFKSVSSISKVGGGSLNPQHGDLDITAGWGHTDKAGTCMPGRGRVGLRSQEDEALRDVFGPRTLDIYLNDVAYWSNVPEAVWDYYVGGYQVVKKWLSYREKSILKRGLTTDEALYVTDMIRRIAALIILHPKLDQNYSAVKADAYRWQA